MTLNDIKQAFGEYQKKLSDLRINRREILARFIRMLEQEKYQEIKKRLQK